MIKTPITPPGKQPRTQPQAALAELLSETLKRGYYGTASLSFTIQDGHVQHLKVSTERQIR